jgi:hypothetical protein
MTGPLEPAADALAAPAILLAGRNSAHAWWTEVVGCTPSGVPVAADRLHAAVTLDSSFLVRSFITLIGPCRTSRRLQRNTRPASVRAALHDPLPRLPEIPRT